MIVIGLIVCLVLELVHLDVVHGKHRQLYEQYDALFVARCEAHCWSLKNKNKCTKLCLLKDMEKPGRCPGADSAISPFAAICLNICKQDSQCPGVTKCCKHNCGITCQHPKDLERERGIPDIPSDIIVTERRRKRIIQLKWAPGESPPGVTIYVVEERHYAGQYFMENRMGDWTPCIRTVKPYAILKRLVKPGRWYQFRVAAVNVNGTRGYSENSLRFITSVGPRPPKLPQNVTVGPLLQANGTLSTELRWKPPNSDLPIDRYKVFWSKRLHGASALDSVLVHQQTVPKDHTKFLLQNLQPNSLYFLQVQALAQFGKDRLKGEKSGLVLNTANYTNATDNFISIEHNQQSRVKGLHLQRLFWSHGELRARIKWQFRQGVKRYTISWWSGVCHRSNNKHNNNSGNLHLTLAATTKSPYFDLYDLEFGCRYRVSVREVTLEGMKSLSETSISFTTPSCKDFQKQFEELICSD